MPVSAFTVTCLLLTACMTGGDAIELYNATPTSMQQLTGVARSCGLWRFKISLQPPEDCPECVKGSLTMQVTPSFGGKDARARQCLNRWVETFGPKDMIPLLVIHGD